jgi:hypothetical protein
MLDLLSLWHAVATSDESLDIELINCWTRGITSGSASSMLAK